MKVTILVAFTKYHGQANRTIIKMTHKPTIGIGHFKGAKLSLEE